MPGGAKLATGATIIDTLEVADGVLVGAGGLVCNSIRDSGSYVGAPVRKLTTARKE
ncbi:hypothetical protein FACS189441_7050 [Betaproteobacteria bacterium]|nr:hypothetical protein FACS189441_7050 [Betaproteobacteria bacterium]